MHLTDYRTLNPNRTASPLLLLPILGVNNKNKHVHLYLILTRRSA
jgi:hypothetical protein